MRALEVVEKEVRRGGRERRERRGKGRGGEEGRKEKKKEAVGSNGALFV